VIKITILKRIKFIGIFLGLFILLAGCFGPFGSETDSMGSIQGVVKVNDKTISGVEVELLTAGRVKQTGSSGEYKFSELEAGTYTVQFTNSNPLIKEEKEVVVVGGKTATVNLVLDFDDTTVQDAKDLVAELKTHGLNLQTTVSGQTDQIENNITEQVAPYLEAVGARLGMIGDTLELWETLLPDGDTTSQKGPGTYIINSDSAGEPEIISYTEQEDLTADIWTWDLSDEATGSRLVIQITNISDIITEDADTGEINADLTAAEYHYSFDLEGDGTSDWNFDFTLTSSAEETITETDEEGTYNLTVPRIMEVSVEGTLADDLHEAGAQFANLAGIGTVAVNGDLSLDLESDNTLSFQGNFNSAELDLTGDLLLELADAEFPSYAELKNEGGGQLVKLTTDSTLETKAVALEGTTEIQFINPEELATPVPNVITFNGIYQDITEPEGLMLTGSLEVDPDFDNYDFAELDSDTNYPPVVVELDGQLENTKYNDVGLTVTVDRDGYQHVVSEFRYEFSGDKFITGMAIFDAETVVDLVATNQDNLGVAIKPGQYDRTAKIGEITNYSGGEVFGEIILIGGEPVIDYSDQTSDVLLP